MNKFSEKWINSDVKPKRRYYRPYDKKRAEDFRERFAIDSKWHGMKMTSHGCFQRHNRTREEQEMTRQETKNRNFEGISRDEWDERRLTSHVHRFQRLGFVLRPTDTLEMFVERCKEELGENEESI